MHPDNRFVALGVNSSEGMVDRFAGSEDRHGSSFLSCRNCFLTLETARFGVDRYDLLRGMGVIA